jgi:NTE family protein
MIGALHAIARQTSWDPGSADFVIGTSAGAMIGALLASAVPPWMLEAYSIGAAPPIKGLPHGDVFRSQRFGTDLRLHWSFPRPVLGSPELALRSLREPWKYGPAGIVAWLPRGVISTEPLKDVVRRVVPKGWSSHPHLWITAIDYATGERVAFGRDGAPHADLASAVAASCAIPGFYHPVRIRGRRYVDGGMYSAANLDLAADTPADIVVCLNPMSSRHRGGLLEPTGRIATWFRGDNRLQIDREASALRATGRQLLLLEPQRSDLHAMGFNYMSRKHVERVVATATETTSAWLRETGAGRVLSALPPGAPDRLRPPRAAPARWPDRLFPPYRRSA